MNSASIHIASFKILALILIYNYLSKICTCLAIHFNKIKENVLRY